MTPIQAFQDFLWSQEEKMAKALPSHLTSKRFVSSACSYLESHPKILDCDRGSIMDSIIKAAQMGLVIDGVESALVPRKQKCTLMVMFQGLLKMVRNSGELKDIQSAVVYEKDEFDYYTDEKGEHIIHRRFWGDRGARKLVFAIARTKDGGIYVEVMDAQQIDAVRKQGYSSSDSPWNGPFQDEMWRKSVIRRIAKRLPSSTDMESFAQDLDTVEDIDEPVKETQPQPMVSSKLSDVVKSVDTPPKTVEEPKPVTEPKPVEVKQDNTVYETTGVISAYRERTYDGGIKRWAFDIDGIAYGTSDQDIATILISCRETATQPIVLFKKVTTQSGKVINEITHIGGDVVVDEKPI